MAILRAAERQAIRFLEFWQRPRADQVRSLRFRFKRLWDVLVPGVPLPVRLPWGGWWLATGDVCSAAIFAGTYEDPERRFVERFLRPGMTVLDIGAHHGFYTLLAARKVGDNGQVIAFEPSPRERRRLIRHVRLNRCRNVRLEPFAVAGEEGHVQLFLVKGIDTGLSSLRRPKVAEEVDPISVAAVTLDAYLARERIRRVGFVKMDVEGAELHVLRGATETLSVRPRPVILCEVQDVRTEPFGYSATEILHFLWERSYEWFKILPGGSLRTLDEATQLAAWRGYNFIAVPEERRSQVREQIITADA